MKQNGVQLSLTEQPINAYSAYELNAFVTEHRKELVSAEGIEPSTY